MNILYYDDYTAEQIGDIFVLPITAQSKGPYSLVVIQPRSNDQILVLSPCSWAAGWKRTQEMVRRGIDPNDIRFTFRNDRQLDDEGFPLHHCKYALWWTEPDRIALEKERSHVG